MPSGIAAMAAAIGGFFFWVFISIFKKTPLSALRC
jgi:uncharacterized integral membrane protein